MLNVADRIRVVEADVSSFQNAGHKRQQCPLSSQKIIFRKLKKLWVGWMWGKKNQ